jgi:hypothetical protein
VVVKMTLWNKVSQASPYLNDVLSDTVEGQWGLVLPDL